MTETPKYDVIETRLEQELRKGLNIATADVRRLRMELASAEAEIVRLGADLKAILKADRGRAKFEHYGTCGQIARAALERIASHLFTAEAGTLAHHMAQDAAEALET